MWFNWGQHLHHYHESQDEYLYLLMILSDSGMIYTVGLSFVLAFCTSLVSIQLFLPATGCSLEVLPPPGQPDGVWIIPIYGIVLHTVAHQEIHISIAYSLRLVDDTTCQLPRG
eukprot:sb/3477004/